MRMALRQGNAKRMGLGVAKIFFVQVRFTLKLVACPICQSSWKNIDVTNNLLCSVANGVGTIDFLIWKVHWLVLRVRSSSLEQIGWGSIGKRKYIFHNNRLSSYHDYTENIQNNHFSSYRWRQLNTDWKFIYRTWSTKRELPIQTRAKVWRISYFHLSKLYIFLYLFLEHASHQLEINRRCKFVTLPIRVLAVRQRKQGRKTDFNMLQYFSLC